MNRQNQWLFEAPLALEATYFSNPYTSVESLNPEWVTEWESQEANPYALGDAEWERSPRFSSNKPTIQEIISGFSRYSNSVKLLPLPEQKKLMPLLNES